MLRSNCPTVVGPFFLGRKNRRDRPQKEGHPIRVCSASQIWTRPPNARSAARRIPHVVQWGVQEECGADPEHQWTVCHYLLNNCKHIHATIIQKDVENLWLSRRTVNKVQPADSRIHVSML